MRFSQRLKMALVLRLPPLAIDEIAASEMASRENLPEEAGEKNQRVGAVNLSNMIKP